MKVLKSDSFLKIAGSFDTQPGMPSGDHNFGPFSSEEVGQGTKDILDRWDPKKKKKKKKIKMTPVYQQGIILPADPRDEAEETRTYESRESIRTSCKNNA